MIQIYCDTEDEMKCLKDTLYFSENCPFTYTKVNPCSIELGCYTCISGNIEWYVKQKVGVTNGEKTDI